MKSVEEMERLLERLAPAPMSEEATGAIESMIDSLAQQDSAAEEDHGAAGRTWRRPGVAAWMSLAAAVLLGAFAGALAIRRDPQPMAVPVAASDDPEGGLEWVGRSDQVGEPEDDGFLADEDGGVHRLLRYRVVEEEVVRDGRSGTLMRVTGPREEMMLVPVSTF